MTQKFDDINKLINDIEKRKKAATTVENRLKEVIKEKEMAFDLAELSGKSTKELSKKISDLQDELKKIERKILAFNKKPGLIAEFLKGDSNISKLAQAIHDDNTRLIAEKQREFANENVRLQNIKAEYLQTVATMGTISREAQEFVNEINHVKKYIPGKKTTFFQGTSDLINRQRDTSLYLSATEIENNYLKGVK